MDWDCSRLIKMHFFSFHHPLCFNPPHFSLQKASPILSCTYAFFQTTEMGGFSFPSISHFIFETVPPSHIFKPKCEECNEVLRLYNGLLEKPYLFYIIVSSCALEYYEKNLALTHISAAGYMCVGVV